MSRRLSAVLASAALAVAVLPATPAFASAASAATLTVGKAVYPAPGVDQTFTIRVTNNEALLVGKNIDAIRVNFPLNEAGIGVGSGPGTAAGFTEAKSTKLSGTQFNTYRGGSLRPGQSVDISFPAVVGAPLARDLLGDFRVQVSSDNFATAATATGDLVSKVQVLEILQAGLKPVAPAGVVDRTGTAGQAITYQSEVKNHARQALSVTSSISSPAGDSSTPATVSVPAGGTKVANIPVTLGAAATNRNTAFAAAATAPNASAPAKTDTFTVQAPAALSLSNLQPKRTKSGAGSAREFTITGAKTGTPAVNALSGTLAFGTNRCSVKDAPTYATGNSTKTLTFGCTEVLGADGPLEATVSGTIGDDNGASYGYTGSALGTITLDNLAPSLTLQVVLPKDRDGDQQTAVRNGNTITVSGNVGNAGDLASSSVRVTLQPDKGEAVVINAPVSGTGEDRTFSGSASPNWDAAATAFTARAEVADLAGNTGAIEPAALTVIDNKVPALNNPGVVLNPTTIEVLFTDTTGVAGGCDARMWFVDGRPNRVTEVRTANGAPCADSGSGGRQLVLSGSLGTDETPVVTYDPIGARQLTTRPAKDGAGNDAVRQAIETVTNLKPLAPELISVERRDGAASAPFETAFFDTDDKQYFTNVGGVDALRVTVGGIRQNYTVQVLRNGAVVADKKFTAAPLPTASSYSGDILVPLPTAQGLSKFSVRLVSSVGNAGDGTPFDVVFEKVVPTLKTAAIAGSTVTVPFSEKVVVGSDFADNWFVSETVDTEDGPARRTVNANSVTANGQTARSLEVTLLNPARFAGADYAVQSGRRYEDRAGNLLADTLS